MNIQIVADSTCDLSPELIEKYHITILPLYVLLGDISYHDGIDITAADIFRYVDANGTLPKTAAVSISAFSDCFAKLLKNCDAILCITISAEFSSCFQNANLAAQNFEQVAVLDSRNLSTGFGHIVLQAAEHAAQFDSVYALQQYLAQNVVPKVDASFIIDRLEYLHKGGRCSAVAALGANMLKLKPCIEVRDGKMIVAKKYRGAFPTCVSQYVRERLANRAAIDDRRIFITHSLATPEAVAAAKDAIAQSGGFHEVLETYAGCTVSSHCGPNTLGVLYLRK